MTFWNTNFSEAQKWYFAESVLNELLLPKTISEDSSRHISNGLITSSSQGLYTAERADGDKKNKSSKSSKPTNNQCRTVTKLRKIRFSVNCLVQVMTIISTLLIRSRTA